MKIVLLTGGSESSLFIYNSINKKHPIDYIIIENSPPISKLIKTRIKKIGLVKVLNQIGFKVLVVYLLKALSFLRVKEIKKQYALNNQKFPLTKVIKIKSVNSPECLNYLKEINPDLIIVNGTRIISKEILCNISCLIINTHVGITPEYRGVHGAYWALINNDKERCGVTVHKVEEGIDTGALIKQSKINITNRDNFFTYPYLQIGVGIELIGHAIISLKNGNQLFFKKENSKSNIYCHPTLTGYLYNYFKNGVK